MASIEEAKEMIKSTPISSVVNYYMPISKKGANFEGVCPFHSDTNPSLKINDSKGIYKCFVCGAAGDAIKFVQDKLNLEFIDAIKDISSNLGIAIEEKSFKNKDPKYDMAMRVLAASHKLYKKVALDLNPQLLQDFLKARNINEESVKNFGVSFAPNNNALTKYLGSLPQDTQQFAINTALEIGLIRPQRSGQGQYDFYRDRVMFPIWDHNGKVRGYSSRAVKPDQKPKYLNSGDSFIFDKGNILYGFNLAKNSIREKDSVIIVEGNMDVLMLHQFGFNHSVGTMGVSLSENSIKLLKNMTGNFILAMDSDDAGIKAMQRINQDLLRNNIVAKYLSFKPAKDPDEFLNEYGRLELIDRIEKAPSFVDFQIQEIIPDKIPESTDQKLRLLREIFTLLAPMKTDLFAQEKIIQAAKALGLKSSSDDIIAEYKGFLQENKNALAKTAPKSKVITEVSTENIEEEIESDSKEIETVPLSKTHKVILETFISHPECTEGEQITEILDLIDHFEVKRVVQWLVKIYCEIDEADYVYIVQAKLKESLPAQIKEVLASSLFNFEPTKLNNKVISKTLDDILFKLKENKIKIQRDELKKKQKQATSDEESLAILGEIQELEKQLLVLRNK
ncbi:MAG: DNA primase [Halobacteriovoraceae bacterium]|nr:DNA primase [Halobacteriovoraceae bacterium]|tara:strand:- start:1227 stop:3089 length:1863 start_codon:yes stop_codon:yes gene_type:complete